MTAKASPLVVNREDLARVLRVSARTTKRLEGAGVIRPVRAPRRGVDSEFDLTAAVPSYLAHVLAERPATAKDRRDEAQAEYITLKTAQARREVLQAAEVHRAAESVVRAATARLLRLEDDLARTLTPEAVAEVGKAVREALEELAALDRVTEAA